MTLRCTIAIPVYNRETLIGPAIESALAQPGDDIEILVIDNCSTDGTWEAIRRFKDPRLCAVRNDHNLGLFGNFNRCLELARGTYVRILCSDDLLAADSLSREIPLMESHPSVSLLSTRARCIDAQGCPRGILSDDLPPGLYSGEEMIGHVLWVLAHYTRNPLNYPSGILFRREAALAVGSFSSEFRLVGDVEYWMRLFAQGDVILADHVGCEVRVHEGQEGNSALASGTVIDEFFILADRQQERLRRLGMEKRIRKQLTGCAIWFAYQFWKSKRPEVARRYWQTALTKGCSPLTLIHSTGRFVLYMKLQAKFKYRISPRSSPRPLVVPPSSEVEPSGAVSREAVLR